MVIEAESSYNIIMGRLALNALLAAVSYAHLCIKYPLPNGRVGTVKGDQTMARKCNAESVKVKLVQKTKADKEEDQKKMPVTEYGDSKKPG